MDAAAKSQNEGKAGPKGPPSFAPIGTDDMTDTPGLWIVKRCTASLRMLGYYAGPGHYCATEADARHMTRQEADQLAEDLDSYAATKGTCERYFAVRHPQESAWDAAAAALKDEGFYAGPWDN